MPEMVSATSLLTAVIKRTPKKLHATAIKIAVLGVNALVPTALPMALGASVQPLTNTTPNTSAILLINAIFKSFLHST
jgi:hypothetical protein